MAETIGLVVILALLATSVGLLVWAQRLREALAQARLEVAGAINRMTQAQTQAALLATNDPVTGLLTRHVVVERFQLLLSMARRHDTGFSIIVIELGGLEHLADTIGPEPTNRVLSALGLRLRQATRESDTIGRIREYEFGVLLPMTGTPEETAPVIAKLRTALEAPVILPDHATPIRPVISFGSATYSRDGQDWPTLLKAADASLVRDRIQTAG